jgi:hypothetical protein
MRPNQPPENDAERLVLLGLLGFAVPGTVHTSSVWYRPAGTKTNQPLPPVTVATTVPERPVPSNGNHTAGLID